jgi:cytidylate kinase
MLNRVVAIDGPSASGKSTVAKKVAELLKSLYVDSGALYRAVTWLALRRGLECDDDQAVRLLVLSTEMTFQVENGVVRFWIDGMDPGQGIRGSEVNENVSKVASMPVVRKKIVEWLKGMRDLGDLVMEGRDIGTAVFPDTQFKFYLDASPAERARRRHAELSGIRPAISVNEIQASLLRRDTIDSGRRMDPLKIAPGSVVIDSTAMSADDVANAIAKQVGDVAETPAPRRGRKPKSADPV